MVDINVGKEVSLKGKFVFVDVETANNQNDICQIGAIVVSDGTIVDIICEYVKPYGVFNGSKYHTDIHGITPDMVANAPTFREVWDNKFDCYKDYAFVAHNAASADIPWIIKNLLLYEKEIQLRYYCTMSLARSYLYGKLHILHDREFSREKLCNALGFPIEKNHDALSDAIDCFRIFSYICGHLEGDLPMPSVCNPSSINYERRSDFVGDKYAGLKFNMKEIAATVSPNDESDADFFQKTVVVSGQFARFKNRLELVTELYKRGATIKKGVSRSTDILIVGTGPGNVKINEAKKLNEEGAHIRIITDEELFYRMLEDNAAVEEKNG